jgi:hypothetical protein
MVAHACNYSTQETETGGSRFQGNSGLHSEFEASLVYINREINEVESLNVSVQYKDYSTYEQHKQALPLQCEILHHFFFLFGLFLSLFFGTGV